ncbi:sulfatase-like hydrolase/transferase [Cognatishimia sp. WU-CL00825]|uniref:sulfatase family protein n=1 Tax=Cognatishimia sp. WU-CL00825 TaxID=3127658 RepID=UPI003107B193
MSKHPNILFILPDQLRADFLGCYGADFLKTPHVDGLAEIGTRYDAAISPSPICVPARASMLTGQDAHETGVVHNLAWLRPDRREMGIETWPERLNAAGYHTLAIGKMHFYPWDINEGFQTRVIAEDKRHIHIHDDYHDALASENFEKLHGIDQEGYAEQKGASINALPDHLQPDRWVADQAIQALKSHDPDQPFAMMVGFPGPHCPYDPPAEALKDVDAGAMPSAIPQTDEARTHHAEFVASYKRPWADIDYSNLSAAEIETIRQYYCASVERIDSDVGRLLNTLRETGQLDNTIVVFSSDHGDYLGDFGLMGKGYFHEPSIRVPLIVADFRAPTQAKVDNSVVSLTDLHASFAAWGSITPSAAATGPTLGSAPADRVVIGVTSQGMMARSQRWKLVRYKNGMQALFDLSNDPTEQINQIAEHPQIREELDAALTASLLEATKTSFADRYVAEAKSPPDHPFHRRDWRRDFPSRIGQDASKL